MVYGFTKECGTNGAFNKRHRYKLNRLEIRSRLYTNPNPTCLNCGYRKPDKNDRTDYDEGR